MRDKRFIAAHRGGPLTKENHRALILWAVDCVQHGIQTLKESEVDERALESLRIAVQWAQGNASVGDAREAAVNAHAAARSSTDKTQQAIYRACGHAVATAHMADHSLRARAYILKAIELKNLNTKDESEWQIEHAHENIRELMFLPLNF